MAYVFLATLLTACDEDGTTGPDGHQPRQIAFSGDTGDGSGVYVVQSDGTDLNLLIDSAGFPEWSPDGSQLAFVRTVDGDPHIFLMNVDSTDSRRLTDVGYNIGPGGRPTDRGSRLPAFGRETSRSSS
jgi:hypothetical protein